MPLGLDDVPASPAASLLASEAAALGAYVTVITKGSTKLKNAMIKELGMDKYECDACGYIYDPEEGDPDNGVPKGTPFEKLPADWVCPLCSVGKDRFNKVA